jgi:23S rRNA pseudouridine2605 synthase
MARPRKNSGNTSFGKQSKAEQSFYQRKKKSSDGSDAGEDKRSRPFGGQSFKKRSAADRPGRFESRFEKKGESAGGFKKRFSSRPDERSEKKSFRKDESRSYGSNTGEEKRSRPFGGQSFKKRSGSDKPGRFESRFEKKGERAGGFKKRFSSRPDERSEKKSFRKDEPRKADGDEKKFRKHGAFVKRGERPLEEGKPAFRKKEERKSFVQSRIAKSQPSRSEPKEKPTTNPDLIRLNKFLANSGVGSRREADELIKLGVVTVNGVTITEMGHKVKLTDDVRYEGRKLKAEKPVYILLNKPKGFITTTDDPQERNTVMSLVASACKERIYPVGRLDRNTTGLLLLTNDGDLADKLTHPSYNVKKIYKAELDKPLTKNDFQKIQEGVRLEEGRAIVDDLAIVSDDKKTVGIELHIGWNRIVRRIFEALGYEVVKLDRVVYAGLDKKDLARGQWRFLKPEEVVRLKHFS